MAALRTSLLALLVGLALFLPAPARANDQEAERTIAAAREAVRANENEKAAVLFDWAISQAPGRRREWLFDLAEQMCYSGRSRQAVPLYRELLAGSLPSPGDERRTRLSLARALSWSDQHKASLGEYGALLQRDPADNEARLGYARVLSWMGRHAASIREYEAVLRRDPGCAEARRSLAQVQSWRGRHRDAQRRLCGFLQEHPDDTEAALMLAQSQDWMGRPDRASETLAALLARHPEERRAKRLLAEIEARRQPEGGLTFQESRQSDDLVITGESFEQNLKQNAGRTTLGTRFQSWSYTPERGGDAVQVQRAGLFARHRASDRSELATTVFMDQIETEQQGESRTVLTYDTYMTLWPNEKLRFDIGSNRSTFDNVKSLKQGITATALTASMDVALDRRTRLTTRFSASDYSDGNRRLGGQIEAERRVWRRRNLFLGARYATAQYAKQLDHGYFNPKSYRQLVATAHVYGRGGPRLFYDLEGSFGREEAVPGGRKPSSSASLRLTYRVKQRLEVQAHHSFFSTRQESSGGFSRRTTGLSLRFGL